MMPVGLFTDYGVGNLYVGQLHWRLAQEGIIGVDLMHDAPRFQPDAAGCLLKSLLEQMRESKGILVAVVDPGVGGDRDALRFDWNGWRIVGPDNGLFGAIARTPSAQRVVRLDPGRFDCSPSFHGRDWFLPVGIELAKGIELDQKDIATKDVVGYDDRRWITRIIHVDSFGNIMTGIEGRALENGNRISVSGQVLDYARTFCEVPKGKLFWYRNSIGLVEVAANQADAAALLGAGVGCEVEII